MHTFHHDYYPRDRGQHPMFAQVAQTLGVVHGLEQSSEPLLESIDPIVGKQLQSRSLHVAFL